MTSTAPDTSDAPTEEQQPPEPFKAENFPPDLLNKQRALMAAYAALQAFSANPELPWAVEPQDGWDDTGSGRWTESKRDKTGGWSEAQRAEYDRLWNEVRERAFEVTSHEHWAAVRKHCGVEAVVETRQALKRAALKPLDVAKAA
ncbi:hypothetical protein [Streptomyces sp. NPDC001536]|uniref:hypothetical protein n=1 Tax=Streptomyces sp. NPDC001536 TaxID=3364583 RepID=UPI0036B33E12